MTRQKVLTNGPPTRRPHRLQSRQSLPENCTRRLEYSFLYTDFTTGTKTCFKLKDFFFTFGPHQYGIDMSEILVGEKSDLQKYWVFLKVTSAHWILRLASVKEF